MLSDSVSILFLVEESQDKSFKIGTVSGLLLNKFSQQMRLLNGLTHEKTLFDLNQNQIANLFLIIYKFKMLIYRELLLSAMVLFSNCASIIQ